MDESNGRSVTHKSSWRKSRPYSVRIDPADWPKLEARSRDQGEPVGTVLRQVIRKALNSPAERVHQMRIRKRLAKRNVTEPEARKLAVAINRAGSLLNQIAARLNARRDPDAEMLATLKGIEDALAVMLRKGPDAYLQATEKGKEGP